MNKKAIKKRVIKISNPFHYVHLFHCLIYSFRDSNVPNPSICTLSLVANAFIIVSNTACAAATASFCVSSIFSATTFVNSA